MARGLAFWRWWVGVLALEGSSVGGSAFYRAQARVRALAVLKFIALERLVLAWVGLRSSARGALSCEGSRSSVAWGLRCFCVLLTFEGSDSLHGSRVLIRCMARAQLCWLVRGF